MLGPGSAAMAAKVEKYSPSSLQLPTSALIAFFKNGVSVLFISELKALL